jgi:hypothetical protein
MGNVFSGPNEQQNNETKNITAIKKPENNEEDLMTSFNMDKNYNQENDNEDTEFPQNEKDADKKFNIPMIDVESTDMPPKTNEKNEENENEEKENEKNENEENNNENELNDMSSTSSDELNNNKESQLGGKERYKKYDLSKLIENLENKIQDGGNAEDSYTFSDNENMEQLKKVILKELDELKKNKVGGSNCDCDNQKGGELYEVDDSTSSSSSSTTLDSDSTSSSSSSDFFAKKSKSKKHHYEKKEFHHENKSDNKKADNRQNKKADNRQNKKADKRQNKKPERREKKQESESSKFHFEPSDTTEVSEKVENIETSNSEEGLSIFPFNSSDIKSSISAKNYKMLRRRV